MKHLSNLTETRITMILLCNLVFLLHFIHWRRNKPRNVLPWPNGSLIPKQFKRPPDISIYIIPKPNEKLGFDIYYSVPYRLQKRDRNSDYPWMCSLLSSRYRSTISVVFKIRTNLRDQNEVIYVSKCRIVRRVGNLLGRDVERGKDSSNQLRTWINNP